MSASTITLSNRAPMSKNPNTKPRALVLRTAGTNCDRETVLALELAGADVSVLHLKRLIAEPARLDAFALVVLPGGFSYGDDIAAGRVYGLELRHGLASHLERFVARGGFVLGVCNGFQILVESGLFELDLAQPSSGPRAASERNLALYDNASNRFECRWIHLRTEASAPVLAPRRALPGSSQRRRRSLRRSGRGRPPGDREPADRAPLRRTDGSPARGAYPDNPNGSVVDVAGICDRTGRVLGLMPHPERNLVPWNHPHWTRLPQRNEGEGLSFYRRLVEAAAGVPV